MLHRIATAAAVALFAVPAARGQDLVAICQRAMHPAVGAWARYKLVGGREDGTTLRMAIVGHETREGARYLWVEVAARAVRTGPGGGDTLSMISKMLVPSFGVGSDQVRTRIVKIGSARPMEMPATQSRGAGTPGTDMLAQCRTAKVIGWERVTVPAGTFRALHIQNPANQSDQWVDPDLPLALVKGTSGGSDQHQMVMLAHGTGAKSQVTGTPQPFNAQLMMQMMMGGARRP